MLSLLNSRMVVMKKRMNIKRYTWKYLGMDVFDTCNLFSNGFRKIDNVAKRLTNRTRQRVYDRHYIVLATSVLIF